MRIALPNSSRPLRLALLGVGLLALGGLSVRLCIPFAEQWGR